MLLNPSCRDALLLASPSYIHTHVHTGQIPVTVVLTESNIYLACENFHQWPLPRLQELPPRETLKPPFSDVHCKDISDIEQIVRCPIWYIPSSLLFLTCYTFLLQILDRDQSSQCVLKFFKEVKTVHNMDRAKHKHNNCLITQQYFSISLSLSYARLIYSTSYLNAHTK